MSISRLWPKRNSVQKVPSLGNGNDEVSEYFAAAGPMTVLLTGSTGNLGAYILDDLLRRREVSKVYCLNRSADAETRQKTSHESRGLSLDFSSKQVRFLQADYTAENLGLSAETYSELSEEISIIIHNAWPVDFNRSLSSFKPSIDGISVLIKLALSRKSQVPPSSSPSVSPRPRRRPTAKILFISSVGAASNWASYASTSRDKIPEVELDEWKLARTGYGQSKLLSERLLAEATRTYGLPVSVVRIGQMAGPVEHGDSNGSWPQREWLPSLIKSSVVLRAVPQDLGPHEGVDWVPVDVAARVLGELMVGLEIGSAAGGKKEEGEGREGKKEGEKEMKEARFYHLSNPTLAQWADILPAIRKYLPGNVETVSFIQWVDLLKETMHTSEVGGFRGADDNTNPAVKLWDMFIHMQDRAIRFPGSLLVTLDTKQTVKSSPSLAALEPVNNDWMELWMRQWKLTAKET